MVIVDADVHVVSARHAIQWNRVNSTRPRQSDGLGPRTYVRERRIRSHAMECR